MNTSVRINLENGKKYPAMIFHYTRDNDENGWKGTVDRYNADGKQIEIQHYVQIRQTTPLGTIYIACDQFNHGAWASESFPGVEITTKDLYWLSLWAVQAIRAKEFAFPD